MENLGNEEASYFLDNGARFIVDILPTSLLVKYSDKVDITGTIDVSGKKVVEVASETGIPRRIPFYLAHQVKDSTSLHYATAHTPAWWIDGEGLKAYPTEGMYAWIYSYPVNINVEEEHISGYPIEAEEGAVVYAAVQAILSAIRNASEDLIGSQINLPQDPQRPSDPDIKWEAIPDVSISSVAIQVPEPIPSYNKINVDLTNYFNELESYISSEEDFEKATAQSGQIAEKLKEIQAQLYDELNKANTDVQDYIQKVNIAIENGRIAQQRLIEQARLQTDVEKTNAIQNVATELQKYQDTLQRYAADISLYQAKANAAVQAFAQGIAKTQVYLQNKISLLENLNSKLKVLVEVYRGLA